MKIAAFMNSENIHIKKNFGPIIAMSDMNSPKGIARLLPLSRAYFSFISGEWRICLFKKVI